MDGCHLWNILLIWMLLEYPYDLGNLHVAVASWCANFPIRRNCDPATVANFLERPTFRRLGGRTSEIMMEVRAWEITLKNHIEHVGKPYETW